MYRQQLRRSGRSRGFTLVELMVALAIGMLMSFGLVRVFANSSETYQALSQTAEQIENGRYAIQAISDDLRLAGFYGEYAFAPAAGAAPPDPCTLDPATMRAARGFYVQAWNNVAVSPVTCIDDADIVPGTDVLVVRRANTSLPVGGLVASEVYLQANSDPADPVNPIIALGSGAFTLLKKDGVTAALRKYHVHIYFVSPCSVPSGSVNCTAAADGGRPIPTLKRLSIAANAAGTALVRSVEAVAEGIEALQIDYGVDTDGDGMSDGAGLADVAGVRKNGYLAAPAAVPDWSNVMSAQVYALARTLEQTVGLADTKTYNLGTFGVVTPGVTPGVAAGRFRRHVFTSHVRLVNPAGRREAP